MTAIKAYAAYDAETPLKPYILKETILREASAGDILYSGVCHSGYTYSKGDWGPAIYPLVPGHETVGKITAVGSGE
jgi:uncharacterized zinc-type alcohol dehydrogenase-like protein